MMHRGFPASNFLRAPWALGGHLPIRTHSRKTDENYEGTEQLELLISSLQGKRPMNRPEKYYVPPNNPTGSAGVRDALSQRSLDCRSSTMLASTVAEHLRRSTSCS